MAIGWGPRVPLGLRVAATGPVAIFSLYIH